VSDLPKIKAVAAELGFNVVTSDLLPAGWNGVIYCPPAAGTWPGHPDWAPEQQRTVILRADEPVEHFTAPEEDGTGG
jgi:hypothetical protein